jgi:hypothetical protein
MSIDFTGFSLSAVGSLPFMKTRRSFSVAS